jgi:hypothetical protein
VSGSGAEGAAWLGVQVRQGEARREPLAADAANDLDRTRSPAGYTATACEQPSTLLTEQNITQNTHRTVEGGDVGRSQRAKLDYHS